MYTSLLARQIINLILLRITFGRENFFHPVHTRGHGYANLIILLIATGNLISPLPLCSFLDACHAWPPPLHCIMQRAGAPSFRRGPNRRSRILPPSELPLVGSGCHGSLSPLGSVVQLVTVDKKCWKCFTEGQYVLSGQFTQEKDIFGLWNGQPKYALVTLLMLCKVSAKTA